MGGYAPPTIGYSGLQVPSQPDILAVFVATVLGLYGQNYYLGNDSPLYELITQLSEADADADSALQLAYNNQSPATAIGAGLSLLVALNGLIRIPASYSTCTVILGGVTGTVITNGVIQNSATGDLWNLPPSVTLTGGLGGTSVTATAQQPGPVNASTRQLTVIAAGATNGWNTVTNTATPVLGALAEADSALRLRQAVSTELPALTILDSTIANVAAVPGVTRYIVLENPTGSTDANGNPAHSVSAVVEGGTDLAVATAIYGKRGIGPLTNGSTGGTLKSIPVTSPNSGVVTIINFARPAETTVYVKLEVHLLPGGGSSSSVAAAIQDALSAYLSSLSPTQFGTSSTEAGTLVSFGQLMQVAQSVSTPAAPFSVQAANFFFGTSSPPTTGTDFSLDFYQFATAIASNITVTFV